MHSPVEDFYIKTKPGAGREDETYAFHIHVDAREMLPEATTLALRAAGLTNDSFDPEWAFFGKDGDPKKKFGHHAPVQHMTFVTSNAKLYNEMWHRTVGIVEQCPAKAYLEGELIIFDRALPVKKFDLSAFERIVPVVASCESTSMKYLSAIDGCYRSLPAIVKQRRLDPLKNGNQDRFRKGEMHLTLRDDSNPRLLELLCNLGFAVPAIPKLIEGGDGRLMRNLDGSLAMIRDIPLTLQAVNMRDLMRIANLAVTLVEHIGGVADGSIKIEFATHFAVLNGVDYNNSVPPVLESIQFRDDFQNLSFNRLGSMDANLAELTRETRNRVKTAAHQDKIARFKEIWSREM